MSGNTRASVASPWILSFLASLAIMVWMPTVVIGNPCAEEIVEIDIKPGSCPNSFKGKRGVLPVAVIGTGGLDVTQIDLSTLLLSRADGEGGFVAPLDGPRGPRSRFEDVATLFGGEVCDCHDLEGDGVLDLSLKFDTEAVVLALDLGALPDGALVELVVTGQLLDGTVFMGSDCVQLVPPGDNGNGNGNGL